MLYQLSYSRDRSEDIKQQGWTATPPTPCAFTEGQTAPPDGGAYFTV
jgi:hypothetical protein